LRNAGVEKVVADGQLTHHWHAIHRFVPHRGGDPLFSGHENLSHKAKHELGGNERRSGTRFLEPVTSSTSVSKGLQS
jgi:hypothetical protein